MPTSPLAIIPLGKPGSGKETAQKIITKFITEEKKIRSFTSDTGNLFRMSIYDLPGATIKMNSFNSQNAKKRQEDGLLQATAPAVAMWVSNFYANYSGELVFVVDGSPRRILEAPVLFEFLEIEYGAKILMLHVEADDEDCVQRMLARQRSDSDTEVKVRTRLEQFNTLNLPTIQELSKDERFHTIRNDGSLEEFETKVLNFITSALEL